MAEEEYPSAPKREVDLGRGVVILPPEKLVSAKKPEPEKKEERKEEKKEAGKPSIQSVPQAQPSKLDRLLLIGVAILSIIAIVLSLITMASIASLKGELKGIASDLRDFSQSKITVTTELNTPTSLQSSVPLNTALQTFTVPIPNQEIEGEGSITVILPAYNFPVSIPWKGKITVFGSVTANASAIPSSEKLNINYTTPTSGRIQMTINAEDLFTGKLSSIIDRLEKLSK
jgi:hypothetical protein